jgi:hypothetical protein
MIASKFMYYIFDSCLHNILLGWQPKTHIKTAQRRLQGLARRCGSDYAVGLEPVQRALEAVICRLFAVAGAVVGVEGVGSTVVHHKL